MSDTEDLRLEDEPEGHEDGEHPDAAGGPEAAVERPEAAVERPDAAVERPDAAVERPDAAVAADGRPVWRVKILYSSSTEYCRTPQGMEVGPGAMVVVPTRYGNEMGKVLGPETDPRGIPTDIRSIARVASPTDLARMEENGPRQDQAYSVCRQKIEARSLPMKLVRAHYLLDEQKILFFFTAESRVDFRELVKDLVSVFKCRIELRQIGVRDEARVVGGLGICGRALCCNSVTDRLRPVSIKMAKEQNLTLNSMKISGPCGRLLCCLSYEVDVYREVRQALPPVGTRVRFDGEEFRVQELNVLGRRARFLGESGRVLDVGFESLSRNPQTQAWELRLRGGSQAG